MQNFNKQDYQQYSTSVFVFIASSIGTDEFCLIIPFICTRNKSYLIFWNFKELHLIFKMAAPLIMFVLIFNP